MNRQTEMLAEAQQIQHYLDAAPIHLFAQLFVQAKLNFMRNWKYGVCSTSHGIDFFQHILDGPERWTEAGEYGNNFRNILK